MRCLLTNDFFGGWHVVDWTISQNNEDHVLVGGLAGLTDFDDFSEERGEQSGAWKFNILQTLGVGLQDATHFIHVGVFRVHVHREAVQHLIGQLLHFGPETEQWNHFVMVVVNHNLAHISNGTLILVEFIFMQVVQGCRVDGVFVAPSEVNSHH